MVFGVLYLDDHSKQHIQNPPSNFDAKYVFWGKIVKICRKIVNIKIYFWKVSPFDIVMQFLYIFAYNRVFNL